MSSRLLPGDTPDCASMSWRRVGTGTATERSGMPETDEGKEWKARLAAAEAEARKRCEQEHKRGLHEGEAMGAQKAAAALEPVLARMARAIAETATYRDRCRKEAEEDVVKLALAVARRILRRELTVDPEAILGLVKVATEKLSLREAHRVRVHPADVAALRKHLEQVGAPAAITVEGDAALERGGLLIETARGTLDASLETQFDQIERGFTDLLRERA